MDLGDADKTEEQASCTWAGIRVFICDCSQVVWHTTFNRNIVESDSHQSHQAVSSFRVATIVAGMRKKYSKCVI